MNRETLKTYSVVGLAVALVASIFYGIQPEPTHYCADEQTQRYCFDISGGGHTRCYLTPEGSKCSGSGCYDTCSTGWQPIPEWASETLEKVKINGNGCMHDCFLNNDELTSYTVCTCENGQYAYAGELI